MITELGLGIEVIPRSKLSQSTNRNNVHVVATQGIDRQISARSIPTVSNLNKADSIVILVFQNGISITNHTVIAIN